MREKSRVRTERRMKTPVLVLCEGDTEKNYVEFLRSKYRLPIQLVPKIIGQQINKSIINSKKNRFKINKTDKIECFLMYDADVESVVEKILDCKDDAVPLLSRPCLEIWFLAHMKKLNKSDISSDECIRWLISPGLLPSAPFLVVGIQVYSPGFIDRDRGSQVAYCLGY